MEPVAQGQANHQGVQARVDGLLRLGTIFSIIWLMGIGSTIAVVAGVKARRLILDSEGTVYGMGRAWWCLAVGTLGLVLWVPIVIVGILNNL